MWKHNLVRGTSFLLWCIRSLYAVLIVMSAGPLGFVWAVSELVQAYYGFRNLVVARIWDTSYRSYALMVGYSLSYLVVPSTGSEWPLGLALVLSAVIVLRIWCMTVMGDAYSSAAPNYVELVTGGPFGWVRHPLAALGVLQRLVFLVGFPSWWNVLVMVWGVSMARFVAYAEEKHLRSVAPGYVVYASMVPSRFWPFYRRSAA